MIPFQLRTLRRAQNLSQEELSKRSRITQGVLSRAEDPDYGNLTLNTIGRIASGLDVAVIIKFVPFSELLKYTEEMTEDEFSKVQTFEQEDAQ